MKKTKNYEMFLLLEENRQINKANLNNLKKSIAVNNMLDKHPIIVNKQNKVIDGQHRLEAAKQLGVEIYYVVDMGRNVGIDEVRLLNANQRRWMLWDHICSYAAAGNQNYQLLKDFSLTYNIAPSVAIKLLSGGNKGLISDGHDTRRLMEGGFVIPDGALRKAELFSERFLQVREALKKASFTRTRTFISALRVVIANEAVNYNELLHKLKLHGNAMEKREGVKEYLRDLEGVYNYGRHRGRVRLF